MPCTAVEPTLPDAAGNVGFREVTVDWTDMSRAEALALQRRLMAREASNDSWRGLSLSVPCTPGKLLRSVLASPVVSGCSFVFTGCCSTRQQATALLIAGGALLLAAFIA